MNTDYWQYLIDNAKDYIKRIPKDAKERESGEYYNAFDLSAVLAIVGGKQKEEVLMELIDAKPIPKARLDEMALEHMIGYVDENQHSSDEIHTLGYLDTPQWIDAIKVLPKHLHISVRNWAVKVDKRYKTNFVGAIDEEMK